LLVDDDAVVLQVLSRVLNRAGYRAVPAADAAEACRRAAECAPDVALLDLNLPDGDGVELAARLQGLHPGLPAVLMTGCPLRLRDRPELAEPFARVLTKPLDLAGLCSALDAALTERNYAPAGASS
jgi:two-component system sensor histidine kinase TorS